jgi:hypothetical protein
MNHEPREVFLDYRWRDLFPYRERGYCRKRDEEFSLRGRLWILRWFVKWAREVIRPKPLEDDFWPWSHSEDPRGDHGHGSHITLALSECTPGHEKDHEAKANHRDEKSG